MKASEVWWAVWYGLISALPLNVIALTLPSFCLLVAHSFVCLLMFVQLNGRGEQITGLIQLKISPAMPVLSFRGKNNPQKLCLWSSEYVHVFLVLFSFFCYHMGRSYLLEEFLERVLLWYFLLGFFFFLLALSINEFCFCIQYIFCPLQRLMPQSCYRWLLFLWSCCYSNTISWTCLPRPFFSLCIAVSTIFSILLQLLLFTSALFLL